MKALHEATLYRDAGAVKRWHTVRTHRAQTVAEHTFGMLMLVKQILGFLEPEVTQAILHHDLPELITGDIPGPTKREYPSLGHVLNDIEEEIPLLYSDDVLSSEQLALIHWADRVEAILWCLEEVRMGNQSLRPTVLGDLKRIQAWGIPPEAMQFTAEVIEDAWLLGICLSTKPTLKAVS